MPRIVLLKDAKGYLDGLSPADQRAYARFRLALAELPVGGTIAFEFRIPRSPAFHRLHFALIGKLFESQEQFPDAEALRKWLEVGAGHCLFVPGPTGRMVAIPLSIRYEALDEHEFREHHDKVLAYLRSGHAARFLWPHLSEEAGNGIVEALLAGFDSH